MSQIHNSPKRINFKTISFADVAHLTSSFDTSSPASKLVVDLIDTAWVQRLRHIKQTGNTNAVYMFAEHSRFGHSIGVAYLAITLMNHLERYSSGEVSQFKNCVAAAALLHDIGHISPGSHLAERIWATNNSKPRHESVTKKIIREDPEILAVLDSFDCPFGRRAEETICAILEESSSVPAWTHQIISGSGWNADRGNWAIVDSAMCSVSYGRYNVTALLDSFRITNDGRLVLQENRLDALTHFFVARDSMYRQVYQHRVLQAADALTAKIVLRLRDLQEANFEKLNIYADSAMRAMLECQDYTKDISLATLYQLTEHWWNYHLLQWLSCDDSILRDLSRRLYQRDLLKTLRLQGSYDFDKKRLENKEDEGLFSKAQEAAQEMGFDPRYYVLTVHDSDLHRVKNEEAPFIMLDNGEIVKVTEVEPLIERLLSRSSLSRSWLVVPKEVKEKLGFSR